ncbi:MAG: ribosome silencing factor [Burkholderiales bacterium]|nr:ribosome silencing factor [Burkholderiales bacterium]
MDIRKLQRAIVDGLEDVKAQDIQVFNTEHLSPLFERVIVAAGASNRQTKALAASVRDAVRSAGMAVLRTEGEENGEWIIVDCGAAVAHIMQPSIRDYYRLEEIWGGKPVAIKLNAKAGGLVKASEGFDEDEDEAPKPKKRAKAAKSVDADDETPAKKAALKKPAAKKTAASKTALPRAKTPAERSTSTRGPARKPTAREAAATKPAGSQAGRAKPAPKTAAGKLAAAAKTRAGSSAAREGKAPVKAASVKKVVVPVNSSRNAATAAKKTAKKTAATKVAVAKKIAARRG